MATAVSVVMPSGDEDTSSLVKFVSVDVDVGDIVVVVVVSRRQ
jgi:hypothetical protein